MSHDIWHYPRLSLAEQVSSLFASNLSHAVIFFAPRRMGKTEFLLKDIRPLAKRKKWQVFYFSFVDVESNPTEGFTRALVEYALAVGAIKKKHLIKRIKKVEGGLVFLDTAANPSFQGWIERVVE